MDRRIYNIHTNIAKLQPDTLHLACNGTSFPTQAMDITRGLAITIKGISQRKKLFIEQRKIIENSDKLQFNSSCL